MDLAALFVWVLVVLGIGAIVMATMAVEDVILHYVPHRKANALRCRMIRGQHKLARIKCHRCGLPRTSVRETKSAIALCDC